MSEPIVSTEGLTKRYGPIVALEDATIEIPRGAWGLLGPNGAGKTTLLRLLLGLTPPSGGQANVLGFDPTHEPKAIRQRIGFVPERDAYVPGLTGVRYVAYAGRLGGLPATDAKQRAHEALNFAGLDEARYRDVADYSQGMRQRAKLAQAIVHDPEIVFLDEPTNGLDPDGREEMLELIDALVNRHGIAAVLASHVLPEVEAVCDGALVLDEGRVVANDRLEALTAVRQATFMVRIRGEREPFAAELNRREARLERTPEGMLLVRTPERDGAHLVLEAAEAADVQVRHLAPARASLEDALVTALEEEAGA